ncbi:MAG: L-aspartate oxidase [Verrucomicrobia bacterium A1]|nr:MAG: L-aspartate oxidase [Verrucomicrobia bacterium A1]
MRTVDCDFLVIGSGLAGLMTAHHLAAHGRVLVATKRGLSESNTNYAQGGIACAIAPGDTIESHVQDTLATGGGLCNEAAVRSILSAGPARIRELESLGISFERRHGPGEEYDLGHEGGHSARRVLHAGDITGQELIRVLVDVVSGRPGIELKPDWMAIDLVTTGWLRQPGPDRCVGAYFIDRATGEILAVRAGWTVLATGGAGKAYLYTTNPDVATGDGVALGWRVGLPVRNMEFVQFHPTCLYHPQAKSFLISEAVRGEGALLLNEAGERFMLRHDPRGELAPRDIVARAIDHEMKTRGDPCVFLDITHKSADFLMNRFPNIYARCLKLGIDMARDRIPVVPAAHYFCGGVEAGVDGRTAMGGLFAVGEVACTGLHGANRLASNSLLEAIVCSRNAADAIGVERRAGGLPAPAAIPDWVCGDAVPSDEAVVVEHNWNEVRTCMWDYVGIVRTNKRLERALRRIRNLRAEIRQYYKQYLVTPDVIELRNLSAVAELIVRCAMQRTESRGLHDSLDYPRAEEGSVGVDTIVRDAPGGPIVLPS